MFDFMMATTEEICAELGRRLRARRPSPTICVNSSA